MGKHTDAGSSGAGANLADAEVAEQSATDTSVESGVGEAGEGGLGIQGESGAASEEQGVGVVVTDPAADAKSEKAAKKVKGEPLSFDALVALVRDSKEQVVRLWHPNAVGDVTQAKNGSNIAVLTGKRAYQLTTGEIITL